MALLTSQPLQEQPAEETPATFDPWLLLGFAALLLCIFVLAPLVEEVILRGVLQTWLRDRLSAWLAVPISAIVFGLIHLDPIIIVSNTVLGFVLAGTYHFSGSLWVPLTIHFVNNLIAGALLVVAVLLLALGGA
ncbi:MAG: CPBP family intramembrane metalloprotease [Anaerolineae bacterium]|nr:CPBP family intramembrane metalloprotease [Anaerolineae bacterium]